MRRFPDERHFIALGVALALAGCSGGGPKVDNAAAPSGNVAAANTAAVPEAPARKAEAQAMESKDGTFEFSYKWPAEAAAIPELDSWLRANGETLRKRGEGEAKVDQASAKKDGFPYHAHSYDEGYAVVANTPAMLVLLSDGYIYTGGAHGMPVNTAIIWDKATKKRLATSALVDIPRLATLSKKRFCDALDKQREEKRGEPVRHDDPDQLVDFVSCVDMTKQLILPVSEKGKALDTIRVVIGPYDAGPFAEGTYSIDLPMDATLMGAVKAPYAGAFAG